MHLRPITVLAAGAAAALLAAAPAAQASFPGNPARAAYVQGDTANGLTSGIATANLDNNFQTPVGPQCTPTKPTTCANNPAWSRDGQRIAFDRNGAIVTMLANGTQRDNFTVRGLFALSRPAFDPTGAAVAFQAVDRDGKRDIYIRTFGDGNVRRLTFAGGAEPAWATDGRIAFTRAGNIYVINADGTGKRRITGKGGVQADWSPDSSKLVFVRGGNTYRVDQDGKDLKKLTGKTGYEPAWQTDGTRVWFHRKTGSSRALYSVNLSASDLRAQISGRPGGVINAYSVALQPGG